MAETTSTTTHHHHHQQARREEARREGKPAARKRKPAAQAAPPAARRPPRRRRRTGRRVRTQAKNETRDGRQGQRPRRPHHARSRASRSPSAPRSPTSARRSRRATASIETAGTLADTFGTRKTAERELKKLQGRYERRGIKARNQLERDVKKARTRLERVVRRNRTAVERDAAQARQRRDEPARGRLQPRRGGRPGRRRRHQRVGTIAKDRIARPRRKPVRFPPRAAGEAAPRVSLPASYPAGRTRRPHNCRRVQHSLLPQPPPCPPGAASVFNGDELSGGSPHAHLRGAPYGTASRRAAILPRATWT